MAQNTEKGKEQSSPKKERSAENAEVTQAAIKVITYLKKVEKRGSSGRFFDRIYMKKIRSTLELLNELTEALKDD